MAKRQTAVMTTCDDKLSAASIKTIASALGDVVRAQITCVKAAVSDGNIETACIFWRAANAAVDNWQVFVKDNIPKPGDEHAKAVAALDKELKGIEDNLDKLLKEADA